MRHLTAGVVLALMLSLTASSAMAQTQQTVVIYGIGANITGTVNVGALEGDLSLDTSEILDKLELAGMARYRIETPRFTYVIDGVFMSLGGGNGAADLNVDLFISEFDFGYRFNDRVEGFIGARYTDLEIVGAALLPNDAQLTYRNGDQFIDPVVGLRVVSPIAEKWYVQAQGDIGGGVDMDLQWQAMLDVGYRPSDVWSVWFGYRGLGQEFDDAGAGERFGMDVTYHGPQVAFAFHF